VPLCSRPTAVLKKIFRFSPLLIVFTNQGADCENAQGSTLHPSPSSGRTPCFPRPRLESESESHASRRLCRDWRSAGVASGGVVLSSIPPRPQADQGGGSSNADAAIAELRNRELDLQSTSPGRSTPGPPFSLAPGLAPSPAPAFPVGVSLSAAIDTYVSQLGLFRAKKTVREAKRILEYLQRTAQIQRDQEIDPNSRRTCRSMHASAIRVQGQAHRMGCRSRAESLPKQGHAAHRGASQLDTKSRAPHSGGNTPPPEKRLYRCTACRN
jgi:hypothetical protein